jgi:membrane-associated protease RseP (regulator of RpoE activity)
MPQNSSLPLEYPIYDPEHQQIRVVVIQPPKRRYWLHALLFLFTILSTLCIGARMQYNFNHHLPFFSADVDYWPWAWAIEDWHRLLLGIPFSASLLAILTAHEMGHFVFAARRRIYATLPFFIPAPTLIGTLGAFIRIKSPIRSRSDLFDVGIAGPIAGFVVALPLLFYGLILSQPLTAQSSQTDISFGLPLIFPLAHAILAFSGNVLSTHVSLANLYLHPVAVAAWFGMFATALNLLPGGQLDGGHIIFALQPRWHRRAAMLSIAVLLALSWYLWAGWLLWAIVLRMTGRRHPDVPLAPPMNTKRKWIAAFALLMLVLSIAPAAIKERDDQTLQLKNSSLQNILQSIREHRAEQEHQVPARKR